jgi:transposase
MARSLAACNFGVCGKVVVPQTDGVNDSESGNPACSKHHRGTTMNHYAGIDVSLEQSSVCIVDASGKIIREGKVASEPQALIDWFGALGFDLVRIGLEAGPLSQWLYAGMKRAGLAVELLETRHVRDAFKAMPVKSDRNDARNIAQLMRLGWFRPVHCKSISAQEVRAMLTARKLVQSKLRDIEMSLRGTLRGFGLKVGNTTLTSFAARIRELVGENATLQVIAESLLAVHAVLLREFRGFEKRLRLMARCNVEAQLLMSAPGVGAIVALTVASAIDDPARFKSSKQVGAHFGMTPKKYQSGQTDITGRISKIGDKGVRTALYQAAHIVLTRPVKGSALKSWAMRLAKRVGMRKAKVALARKLGVILHRMLADRKPFAFAATAA